ncbi:nucleoside-diphosphate-sugar epimerase [Herbaspirillum sp. CF444]|uniref:SDR family oxidoreductase n=1 Tax=Herbaspirillum sp. CF444 TaxID=1144319 RepID=UPI0002727EB8|nr:aldehyde reductase [Herbaspirillum sp. CF444]EJL87516.1 nucleoside-diphosphate-sugar epimerase [Herbaspirillum sp. CF444]
MANGTNCADGELVLVTGGSGFIGAHCIVQLLEAGYRVRTTLRSLSREAEVRAMLHAGGVQSDAGLSFVTADLLKDAGWAEAVAGCAFVLHVASPFPASVPKHEDDLIVPAREGTLRVLRAARDAGVRRVVLTSSFAAVGYGMPDTSQPFTEENWTNPDAPQVAAYYKSKTLAERAAWDFIAREGGALELSVVNPVGVFGPALGADVSTSIEIIRRMMDGEMPGLPRITFSIVDVRDVAQLHLLAMTDPAATGQRFLAVAGESIPLQEVARMLKARMGKAAARVPTRLLPNWLLRVLALLDRSVALVVPELGKVRQVSNDKARRVLGWAPRSNEEAIVASAQSLLALGLLKKK